MVRRSTALLAVVALLAGLLVTGIATVVNPAPASAATATSRFVPMTPVRIVDTRSAAPGPLGALAPEQPITVDVSSVPGRPSGTLVAAAVTITMVDTLGPGFATAWPAGGARPEVSNVNTAGAGVPVPNFAIVPLSANGRFSLSTSAASHVLVDLAGVFVTTSGAATAGRMIATTPTRVLDTRSFAPLAPQVPVDVTVAGQAGVPATASAVAVTVTGIGTGPGYVTAWPRGTTRPEVSTLNISGPGHTVANLAVVPLTNGQLSLFSSGGAHVILDVVGYVTGSGAASSTTGLFVPAGPTRELDTRQSGQGPVLRAATRRDAQLDVPAGYTAGQFAMAATNLTVTGTNGGLYLTAYPARTIRPGTSNVNADTGGQSVAAFGLVPLGQNATLSLWSSQRTDALVDVAGFFLGAPATADPDVAPTSPTDQGSPAIAGFDEVITNFLGFFGIPGASVAVAEDGRVVYARSYGTADPATGEPTRTEHHFRIASISKVLTGATIQRLVTLGQLRLDQTVWPLVSGAVPLPATVDARFRDVTVRQLLGHTSGMPATPDPFFDDTADVQGAFGPAGPTSCAAAAQWIVSRPLGWDPGTHYSYANVNFCLLGLVIEKVTGRPWSDVVRELVQTPRGVSDMYLGRSYERQPLDVVHATPGLNEKGGGWFMESIGAAGAWMGTPVDVVRIVDGLDSAKPGTDLLTTSQLSAARARPATDRGDDLTWYGLGMLSYRRGTAFGHTGALAGSRTMTVHEADGITWSIMVNAKIDDHQDVLMSVMDAALATVTTWPNYDLSPDLP